ncbi:MAG: hypothetical protein IAE89_08885, partial [Anaerolineae bacterium]|nr:hypothetical protein [Anaerolineae bacterium]
APDASGQITITGDSNAVFPGAYIAIRNLYTGETTFTQAGLTGSFRALLTGVQGNPFSISPSQTALNPEGYAGSLPGGPATIVSAPRSENLTEFSAAGLLDDALWAVEGGFGATGIAAGGRWSARLRVIVPADIEGAMLCQRLLLMPIALRQDLALIAVTAPDAQNGWSHRATRAGMGIVGADAPQVLGERCAPIEILTVSPDDDDLVFMSSAYSGSFPVEMAGGLYVPLLEVSLRADETEPAAAVSTSRLPVVLRVGVASGLITQMPTALFWDNPSDGSRGVLPTESPFALANRVRYDSPTYILPPGEYPIEPYILNLLANRYDGSSAPLVPLALPGGTLSVTVTAPDGTRTMLSGEILQMQAGAASRDEAALFGRQSPVDTLRLTTRDSRLGAFSFDQYGQYRISLSAGFSDIFGNAYRGGGSYQVLIAEPLDLTPALLPGAPVETGYPAAIGAHIAPSVPAEVTAHWQSVELEGATREITLDGTANDQGIFSPEGGAITAENSGEYRLTYEARYTDSQGRLWAGSMTTAGVMVAADSRLIGRGERGVMGENSTPAPAWFTARQYVVAIGGDPENVIVNTPYNTGDWAFIGGDAGDGFAPRFLIQDGGGDYARWMLERGLDSSAVYQQNMPVAGTDSYSYLSAVRPGVTVRQYATYGETDDLPLYADSDDPVNGQIGAGINGVASGDVIFFFNGAVIRDEEANILETAVSASTAVVIANEPDPPPRDPPGVRVYPSGHPGAGIAYGGDQNVSMFIVPLGATAGDVYTVGDRLAIAGQVAPIVPAEVQVTITAPDGSAIDYEVTANAYGYFFDPAHDLTLDQTGVWTVLLNAEFSGLASIGRLETPLSGGARGAAEGEYQIYVVAEDMEPLPWNPALTDAAFPPAIPYNFSFTAPEDWTNVRAYRTLTMPGAVLQDGEVRLTGRNLTYIYSPDELNDSFPNVEVAGRAEGTAAADTKTLTIAFTGIDAEGTAQIRTRVITLFHDRMVSMGR